MREKRDYQLELKLREIGGDEAFTKNYKIALRKEFIDSKNDQGLAFHADGLLNQLAMNNRTLIKQDYVKWQICTVNFNSSSVGSEIIGLRPAIIYKSSQYLKGEDTIVIPLTSASKQKLVDHFDIPVGKDHDNKLYQNSYARLRQLRVVSYKRVGKVLGIITDKNVIETIEKSIKEMLGLNE